MTPELLDKIIEIKSLANLDIYDRNNVRIIAICEQIETDDKIEKRLKSGQSDKIKSGNLV